MSSKFRLYRKQNRTHSPRVKNRPGQGVAAVRLPRVAMPHVDALAAAGVDAVAVDEDESRASPRPSHPPSREGSSLT